jgi:hypothetical protein
MTSRQPKLSNTVTPPRGQPRMSADAEANGPPKVMSTQDAIYMINNRLKALEQKFVLFTEEIERKFGENEAFVTDNIPDMDQFSTAIRDINTRLLDLNDLEGRISVLESSSNTGVDASILAEEVAPPQSPVLAAVDKSKKKRGTVKLTDS